MNISNVSSDDGTIVNDDEDDRDKIHLVEFRITEINFTQIDDGDIVELSHVDDNNHLYIRAVKYDESYVELMKKSNAVATQQEKPFFLDPVEKDQVVLVKCWDFSRGAYLGNDTFMLIDIGRTIKVKSDDIRAITPESYHENRMALPIQLNVGERDIKDTVNKFLNQRFTVKSKFVIETHSVVDLVHFRTG